MAGHEHVDRRQGTRGARPRASSRAREPYLSLASDERVGGTGHREVWLTAAGFSALRHDDCSPDTRVRPLSVPDSATHLVRSLCSTSRPPAGPVSRALGLSPFFFAAFFILPS